MSFSAAVRMPAGFQKSATYAEPQLNDARSYSLITPAVEVCGGAQQVHGSAGHFQYEEHIDPLGCDCAQAGFSLARRSIRVATAFSTGGRPRRGG
jgi:hypothetical protein